jgi:hypothetical protein
VVATQGAVRPDGLSHPPIAIDEAFEISADPVRMSLKMLRPDDWFCMEGDDRVGAQIDRFTLNPL